MNHISSHLNQSLFKCITANSQSIYFNNRSFLTRLPIKILKQLLTYILYRIHIIEIREEIARYKKKKIFNFNLSFLEFNFTYTTDTLVRNSQKIRNMKILFLSNFSLSFELVSFLPSSKWQDPRNRIVDRNRGKWVGKNTSRPISRKVNLAKLFRRGGEVVRNQFDIQFLSLGRFVHHREKAERRLPRSTDSISWPTTRICQSKFPLPRKLSTKYNRALKAGRIEPRVATGGGGGERESLSPSASQEI